MKKLLLTLTVMLTMTVGVSAQQKLGKMEAYYAKKAMNIDVLGRVKPGDLLVGFVAGNEDGFHMEDKGSSYYYVDPLIADNEFSVAKANVDVKVYEMNALPVSEVGQCLNFVSRDGLKARIFKSDANGHHYEKNEDVNSLGINLSNCYVLSVEYMEGTSKKLFEEPVEMKNGNIMLRGILSKFYVPAVDRVKSSYGEDGKLLVDQKNLWGYDFAVAYVGSDKALYFEGKLYYLANASSETTSAYTAAPQSLDDLPLDDIFKLVDNEIDAKSHLAALNYKYVGAYGAGGGYQMTWCRNCTCNKQGDVLGFQKGTSSIVCISESMGSGGATLSIEVFNTNARDAVLETLNRMGFKVDSSISNAAKQSMLEIGIIEEQNKEWTTFSRKTEQWGQTADVQKSKKGWIFTVWPIATGTE